MRLLGEVIPSPFLTNASCEPTLAGVTCYGQGICNLSRHKTEQPETG
jgi:hypothetical protein